MQSEAVINRVLLPPDTPSKGARVTIGIIRDFAFRPARAPAPPPRAVRLQGRLGSSEHEQRVATIATRLFELMRPKHNLGRRYRELLHTAALLHDAAKTIDPAGHESRGAEMVLVDRTLDLTPWQRRAVAFLVRYHRGPVPIDAGNGLLQRGDGRGRLLVLLAFLRAADALDSRRLPATALIIRRSERKLRVRCLVEGDAAEARRLLGGRGKFKLLEKRFGVRVRVRVEQAMSIDH